MCGCACTRCRPTRPRRRRWLRSLKTAGFEVPRGVRAGSLDVVAALWQDAVDGAARWPYPVDSVVIKLDDLHVA
jgi:NAD-dependent DNA ligase